MFAWGTFLTYAFITAITPGPNNIMSWGNGMKQGFVREEILDVLHHAAEGKYRNVRILGLMGMATLTDDEAVIRSDFSKLIATRDEIRSDKGLAGSLPENFGLMSFGMTHDYKIAVAMGADIVRIGTLIFGQRI